MNQAELETDRPGELSNRELWGWLWPLFRPQWPHFAGALGLLAISSGLLIAGPLLVKRAIDVDIALGDRAGLRQTVLLYLAIQLVQLLTNYGMRNWLEWAGQQMMAGLRVRIFDHLLELPLAFHDRNTPGRLMSRVESDTQALRMLFTTTVVMLLGDLLLFVGMFVAMAWVSPRLTLVTALLLPCLAVVTYYFQRRIHPAFVKARSQNAALAGRLTEFLQSMPVLWAFERRRWALTELLRLNKRKLDTQYEGERLFILWFNVVHLVQALALGLILGIGGYWALSGLVTIGTLAMFIGYVRRFFEPLMRLSEQLAVVQKALAATERIVLLLREPVTIADPASPAAWPGRGAEVRFENVWFRYSDDGQWVLKDVSFRVPARERWALVGPTGSGKTTIISLLLRFYDPQRGRILIDGVDLRELRQRELRGHAGQVMQDIYLFPGDLAANLTLGRDCPPEAIEAAARTSLADRFIQKLPGGYHATLAERGANLSVGQRQMLSFTRALLREPQLLVLDEATSAIDPATEALLGEATRRLLAGRTALVVAHRLSTIRDCSRILVLQHGTVAQEGTHTDLLATEGLYRTLHQLQLSEAESEF